MPARQAAIFFLPLLLLSAVGCPKARKPEQQGNLNRELFQAVDHGEIDSARRLLDEGANIETTGYNDLTPLGAAASHGDLAMVELLLQKGAAAHSKDHSLLTPLMHAAYGGHSEIVRLLLKQDPDLAEKNAALLEATDFAFAVVVIKEPQKDHSSGTGGSTEREISALNAPQVESIKLLLDSGADIEATDPYRGSPLINAAAHAQTDAVRFLLARGANPKARDRYGNTALIAASCECTEATMNDAYDVVKMLVEKGSDVNAHSDEGTTALMNAAGGFGGSAIVKLLLDHGADPRARDSNGNTALKYAKDANRNDKVLLIKQALAKARRR